MSLKDEISQPGLFQTVVLASIEKAINQALIADPASMRRMAKLSGYLVKVQITLPPITCFMLIVEDGVELYHDSEANADVTLRGSSVNMMAQFFEWRTRPAEVGGPITIEGNQQIMQSLLQISRDLRIDWGALLEPLVGGELAQAAEHTGRQALQLGKDLLGRLAGEIKGRLEQPDNGLLALRHEVFEFNQDVDELRMDMDRLELRVQRLQQTAKPSHSDDAQGREEGSNEGSAGSNEGSDK